MEVGESSCSTPAQSSPQRQVQSKAVSKQCGKSNSETRVPIQRRK